MLPVLRVQDHVDFDPVLLLFISCRLVLCAGPLGAVRVKVQGRGLRRPFEELRVVMEPFKELVHSDLLACKQLKGRLDDALHLLLAIRKLLYCAVHLLLLFRLRRRLDHNFLLLAAPSSAAQLPLPLFSLLLLLLLLLLDLDPRVVVGVQRLVQHCPLLLVEGQGGPPLRFVAPAHLLGGGYRLGKHSLELPHRLPPRLGRRVVQCGVEGNGGLRGITHALGDGQGGGHRLTKLAQLMHDVRLLN
mmetsp:Transcript_15587/g.36267  ORF Transcript_15587/g.36267 Transcript_15587/m.36267 type:complete len:245 (-) Transcript_15587:1329-2063(-)